MLKILWKRGDIAPEEQFLLLSTIHVFCYLMLDFYVKIRIRFSFRDKRLFEITEVEISRVDCILHLLYFIKFLPAIIIDSYQMPCSVESELGLHCLHMFPKKFPVLQGLT